MSANNKILAVSGINQNITHSNTTKQASSAQNKVNQSFHSVAVSNQAKHGSSPYIVNNAQPMSSSFAERRLSAKIVENHKKTHHGYSKSGGASLKGPTNSQAIQYENLML